MLPAAWLNPGLADENGTRLTTPDVWLDDVGMAVMIHSREFHAGALQWDATVVYDSELSSHRIVVVGVTPEQRQESLFRAAADREPLRHSATVRVPPIGRGYSETCVAAGHLNE